METKKAAPYMNNAMICENPELDDFFSKTFNGYYDELKNSNPNKKRKRQDVIAKQTKIAKIIMLNLFVNDEEACSLSLSKRILDRKKNRYNNSIFDYNNTSEAIKILSELNWINIETGKIKFSRYINEPFFDLKISEIDNTQTIPTVIELSQSGFDSLRHKIKIQNIIKGRNETVVLKVNETGKEEAKDKKLQDYVDNAISKKHRNNLATINNHLKKYRYTYLDKGLAYPMLYRVFHNDFEHMGRFQGGLFQDYNISIKKEQRKKIRIDNEPLAELDFRACALSILLIKLNLPLINEPYTIGKLANYPRDFSKGLVNALIFAPKKLGGIPDKIKAHLKDTKHQNKDDKIIISEFLSEHLYLVNGKNFDIFMIESTILEKILLMCVEANIACIPLHDCIYVKVKDASVAENIMKSAAIETIGKEILVRTTVLNEDSNRSSI